MSAARGGLAGAATLALVLAAAPGPTAAAATEADAHDEAGEEGSAAHGGAGHHGPELSDEVVPVDPDAVPERPRYLLELGNPYLGTGRIRPGITLPTGAVWQPSLILFGNLRTALQSYEDGAVRVTELAARLDLFANLQLSGTERLVLGFRNLDRSGRFTSYVFDPDPGTPEFRRRFRDDDRFQEELNLEIQSLFFEGDFGEIFPRLDREDFGRSDIGFSIGRQPLVFQDGILISDSIDALGLTRNTLLPRGTSNLRITFLAGAGDVHRAGVEDRGAEIVGLLTSVDVRRSTVDADLVYVAGDRVTGDLVSGGVSATQRLGRLNTTFRVLASSALGAETAFSTDGVLAFSEVSWTPRATHDLAYVNAFWAVDEFSSAARGPDAGGPLGRAGIGFAAVGLGSYGAPMSSRARDVAGAAAGYQKFFGRQARRQLLGEVGLRLGTGDLVGDAAAATLRYQSAFGRRVVMVLDGFGSRRRDAGGAETSGFGGRFEFVLKF